LPSEHRGGPTELSQIIRVIDRSLQSEDVNSAAGAACGALESGLTHPRLFEARARWHWAHERPADALNDFQRAYEMSPREVPILIQIARCLNTLGRHRLALVAAGDALALDGNSSAAWYQKAFAHHALAEMDAAWAGYKTCAELNPDHADALARLAIMACAQGDSVKARDFAAQALTIDPFNAMARTARISADIADRRFEDAGRQLDAILADPAATPPMKAAAAAQIGDVHDALGHPDEAFAAYSDSGALWRSFYERRVPRPAPESPCEQLSRLAATLRRAPAGQWR